MYPCENTINIFFLSPQFNCTYAHFHHNIIFQYTIYLFTRTCTKMSYCKKTQIWLFQLCTTLELCIYIMIRWLPSRHRFKKTLYLCYNSYFMTSVNFMPFTKRNYLLLAYNCSYIFHYHGWIPSFLQMDNLPKKQNKQKKTPLTKSLYILTPIYNVAKCFQHICG